MPGALRGGPSLKVASNACDVRARCKDSPNVENDNVNDNITLTQTDPMYYNTC